MADTREILLKIKVENEAKQSRLIELEKEIAAVRKEQAALNKEFKASPTDALAAQSVELKNRLKELGKEQREIVRTQELSNKATKAEIGSNEQLRAQLALLTQQYNKLSAAEREATTDGLALQKATKGISDQLKVNEGAVGDSRRNVGNYQSALKGLQGNLLTDGALLGPLGVSVGSLTEVFTGAIQKTVEFDGALGKLRAILGSEGTAANIAELDAEARRLGATTQFTASQVVELQTAYAQGGFNVSAIKGATAATLDLAVATQSDLGEAAKIVGDQLSVFNLLQGDTQQTAENTTRVTDVLAESFNRTKLDLENFANSIKFVGPIANQTGVTIEGTAAALGVLADNGVRGSQAGTGLQRILSDLSDENSKLSKAIGFSVKNNEDLAKAFQVLRDKGITTADAVKLVGREAQTELLILAQNAEKVNDLTAAFDAADGSAKRAAETVGNTLAGAVKNTESAFEGLQLEIGKQLTPLITGSLKGIQDFLIGFTSFIGKIPGFIKPATNAIEQLGQSLGFVNKEGQATELILSGVEFVIRGLARVIEFQITLFNSLVKGFKFAYDNAFFFRNAIDAVVGSFRLLFDLVNNFPAATQGALAAASKVWENFKESIVLTFESVGDILKAIANPFDKTAVAQAFASAQIAYEKGAYDLGRGVGKAYNEGFATAETFQFIRNSLGTGKIVSENNAASPIAPIDPIPPDAGGGIGLGGGSTKGAKSSVIQVKGIVGGFGVTTEQEQAQITAENIAAFRLNLTKETNAQLLAENTTFLSAVLSNEVQFTQELGNELSKREQQQLKYAQALAQLENVFNDTNTSIAQGIGQTISNLDTLFKEGTTAAKISGIAQATINTFVGATVALRDPKLVAAAPLNFIVAGSIITAGLASVAKIAGIKGFYEGGFTGMGSSTDAAGIVHKNEYVFDAAATRAIGVDNLEQLRQSTRNGYFNGGLVSAGISDMVRTQGVGNATPGIESDRILRGLASMQVEVSVKEITRVQNRVKVKET